nr:MAG TPA: hypothetical protein [Caudoviricetes sp.]
MQFQRLVLKSVCCLFDCIYLFDYSCLVDCYLCENIHCLTSCSCLSCCISCHIINVRPFQNDRR